MHPKLGFFSVVLVALMTIFYRGLFELSKSFLDPFGIDGRFYMLPYTA